MATNPLALLKSQLRKENDEMQCFVYKKRKTFVPFGCTIPIIGNSLVDFIRDGKENRGYLNKFGTKSYEIIFNAKKEYPTIREYLENAIFFCVEFNGRPVSQYIQSTLKKLKADANTAIPGITTDLWINFAKQATKDEQLFFKTVLMPFARRKVFLSKYVNLIIF